MKSKKEDLIAKLNQLHPYINIPYSITSNMNGSPMLNELKQSIEWAIKDHVNMVVQTIVNDIYTHEEFEEDIGIK